MRRIILGTAGHIDHGKTALIKALTGIDTDRLREEKARGISIDLGFAYLDLASGTKVGIVDVPGHERFIKNMLAGAGGVDLVLFVVACDEGIMPQTREHFDIVSLLGVKHAVFALTKSDLADEEMIDIIREDVKDLVDGTVFKGSAIIPTSTKTGHGLDEVLKALDDAATAIEERPIGAAVRLPIDLVFTMTGRGTVVTGTLWSGTVSKEDRLEILPGRKPVRVRSVEVHSEHVDRAFAGQRTALGIHGVEKREIERGYCVVSPGDFEATTMIDVELYLLPASPKPLQSRARVRFHLGASEVMGRVFLVGTENLTPGQKCLGQVRLETQLVAAFGDRFVIRTYSPMRTVGGGKVLDPLASKHRKHDQGVVQRLKLLATEDMPRIVEEYIRASSLGVRLEGIRQKLNRGMDELESIAKRLLDEEKVFVTSTGSYMHADTLREFEDRVEMALKSYQAKRRLTWGMPKEELRERLGSIDMAFLNWVLGRLEAHGRIFTRKGSVRAGTGDVELSPDEQRARSLVIGLLKEKLFQPPSEGEIEAHADFSADTLRKVVNLLIDDGQIIRLEPGLIMHSTAIDEAKARITAYLKEHGEATAGELKGVLGTSRKYAVPLLEHLDKLGITKRKGNKRTLLGVRS